MFVVDFVAYGWICNFIICFGLATFLISTFGSITSPYGKLTSSNSFGVNPRLGWFLMESPSLFMCLYCYFTAKGSNPLHISTLVCGAAYTGLNGYIQGTFLGSYYFEYNSPDSLLSPYFIIGSIIFFLGIAINVHCDSILRRLAATKKPGDQKGYKIPYGGAFNFVTAGNYFGEIFEWFGFAIAQGLGIAGFTFLLVTLGNLVPRAVTYHTWYRKQFPDYPKNRKIIIPFIY